MISPLDPAASAARLAALMQRFFGQPSGRQGKPDPHVASRADQQLLRRSTTDSSQAASVPATERMGQSRPAAGKHVRPLASTLQSQVNAIPRDHPQRRKAAIRLLVAALLSEEFDAEIANDPYYQAMLDDVTSALDESPGLKIDMDRVLTAVLGQGWE